jgi:hypothetical protein
MGTAARSGCLRFARNFKSEWNGAGIFAGCKFFAPCETGASGVTMTLCNVRNLVRDVPRARLIDSRPNSLFLRHGIPAVPRKIPCSGKQGIRRLNLRNCMVIGRVHLHSWADPAQIPCRKAESSSAETAHTANTPTSNHENDSCRRTLRHFRGLDGTAGGRHAGETNLALWLVDFTRIVSAAPNSGYGAQCRAS